MEFFKKLAKKDNDVYELILPSLSKNLKKYAENDFELTLPCFINDEGARIWINRNMVIFKNNFFEKNIAAK